MDHSILTARDIGRHIYAIRGKQVMLDSDLAAIYQVETKVFNQAVKRNSERFPPDFCFQLTETEWESLRSQFVTLETGRGQYRKYLPHAFTEQGVAMLSAVLRSDTAVKVSIEIISAFVEMRRTFASQAVLFQRLDTVEGKQREADLKFEELFKALENGKLASDKGIFYDGQVFDAYTFVSDIIRSAKKSIILIDNYVDDTVLTLLGKRRTGVSATICTKNISSQLLLDLQRYNSQYPKIEIEIFTGAHDRFLLIDSTELYHIGASLKDLGKKWFAFSKINKEISKMLQFLSKI